jgi:hypothetical protein
MHRLFSGGSGMSHTPGAYMAGRLCLNRQSTDTSLVIHILRLLGQAASQLSLLLQPSTVMGKVHRASKGKLCLTVFGSKSRCKRALDKSGLPIALCKNCIHCGGRGVGNTAGADGKQLPKQRVRLRRAGVRR